MDMCPGGIPDNAADTLGVPSGRLPHCQECHHMGMGFALHGTRRNKLPGRLRKVYVTSDVICHRACHRVQASV